MKPYYDKGGIRIFLGDCREITEWTFADIMVTDPPFGIKWSRGLNKQRASKSHDGIVNDDDTSCRDDGLGMFGNKPAIVFGSFYAPFPKNVRQVLVWHKPPDSGVVGSTTGYRRDAEPIFLCNDWLIRPVKWSSVVRSAKLGMSAICTETGHPHTKPVDLISNLILNCPDGVIADPFMGSGTTLRAAKDLGRKAIGIEIEERYAEIAAKRMEQEVFDFEPEAVAT